MNICIIGCSHSCGNPFTRSDDSGIPWTYDRNSGWVAGLAMAYPQHNFYNWSTPGTGFSVQSMLVDKADACDWIDLIILQQTQVRHHIPLNNFVLHNYELTERDSPTLNNLQHKWFNTHQAIVISWPFIHDKDQSRRDCDTKYLNVPELSTTSQAQHVLADRILLNTGWRSVHFQYQCYIDKIQKLSKMKKILCFNWGSETDNIVIDFLMNKHSISNRREANALLNTIMEPFGGHFPNELQHLILKVLINPALRHFLE